MERALRGFARDELPPGDVPSHQRRSSARRGRLLRIAAVVIAALVLLGVVLARRPSEPRFDRRGIVVGTLRPFAGVAAADVYIVPLDRPAWYADGAFSLLKLQHELSGRGLKTMLTAPLAITKGVYDATRHQLNGDALSDALDSAYARDPSAWPPTVIGVTSLDMYSPTFADDRFALMASHGRGHAGFTVISTARMHSGFLAAGSAADLEKMALRAVGLYFYRLPRTGSWTVMHDPIRSLDDLEQMSDQYGVPRTLLEQRQAEQRAAAY